MSPDAQPQPKDTPVARASAPAPSKPDAPVQTDLPASTTAVAEPEDTRQQWYCVDPYGPRTRHGQPIETKDALGRTVMVRDWSPPFRSNAHLNPENRVQCPACKSFSVMRVEQWDAAHAAGV